MRKLVRGCILACALAGCTGDAEPVKSSQSTAQPIKLSTDTSNLVIKPTSFGKKIELQPGQFENAVMARRNADGSVSIECHDDEQQAEAFLQRPAAAKLEVQ